MIQYDHRHLLEAEFLRRSESAMAGDDDTVRAG
jgi:hypothetical protein